MKEILKIDRVQKSFGKTRVLKGITFSLMEGEFLTIIGPNGAGKTTLLNCISQNIKEDSGKIFFKGKEVRDAQSDFKEKINYISHNLFLYDQLTPLENLLFFRDLYNLDISEEKILELLKKVDLFKFRNKPVSTFSRGMKQRLTIVRAILNNPEVILLDEPFTGLDIRASEILSKMLLELKNKSRSVLMITHNLIQAKKLSDRILGLNKGVILFELKKDNFYELESKYLSKGFK